MLLSKSVRNYCRFLLFSCSSGQPTSSAALPIRCHLLCQLSLLFLPNANQPEFPWLLTKQSFLNKQNKTHDGVDGPVDQTSQFNCTMHCTVLYCTVLYCLNHRLDDLFVFFLFSFRFVLFWFCFGFGVSTLLTRSIRPSPPFYCDVRVNDVILFEIFL